MQKSNEMMKENAKETNKQEETNTYNMSKKQRRLNIVNKQTNRNKNTDGLKQQQISRFLSLYICKTTSIKTENV